jgi:hypothetical protein
VSPTLLTRERCGSAVDARIRQQRIHHVETSRQTTMAAVIRREGEDKRERLLRVLSAATFLIFF